MCKGEPSKPAANDSHTTTRLPMAKSRNWFVPTERIHLYHCDWLLFQIPRSYQAKRHHLRTCNWGPQSSLFTAWHPRDSGQWQWTTILIIRVYWLCQAIRLLPFNKQSTIPQSNGQAERGVQTVKGLLKEVDDPYMSLLNYRTTPFPWCNFFPAELSMGRQLRSNLPQT